MDRVPSIDVWPAGYVVAPPGARGRGVSVDHADKLACMGRLAAGIAHEINTPVQYVSDNLAFLAQSLTDLGPVWDIVRRAMQGEASPGDLERLGAAARSARLDYLMAEMPDAVVQSQEGLTRVAETVRAVREFSHPPALQSRAVDVPYVVDNAVKLTRHVWRGVADLRLHTDEQLCVVQGYPGRLQQVFVNLVVNAAHAIAAHGEDAWGHIDITVRAQPGFVEVVVEDDGVGIEPGVGSRVFDPFYTTKGVGEGTGQGLALVHATVDELHGGAVAFYSAPHAGTTMVVRLALAGGQPARSEQTEPGADHASHSVCG